MPVITLREGRWGFLAALGVIILIAVFRKRAIVLLLAVTLALLWWTRFPAMDWQIVSCDVGQGDATVINLHRHRAIVIDVGPDPVLIDSCLRNLHITTISLLILTHPHADHIGGLTGARKGRTIEHQWFENVAAGTTAHIGEYSIKVLWPLTIGAQDENPNNISIAAVITSRDLTLFAAGDIEPDVQSQLYGKVGHVDIYKVAHHGSRYQDGQLMSEIDPTLALISVGKGNTYGHPAASTISSLESLGARVLRTDRDGAIAVEVKSHRIRTRTRGSRLQWFGLG
jgi:competence protein ComEC